jgi:hypothetical protein
VGEISNNKEVTLLEVVERLLDKGVVISGDLILSVADIDLVYLNLRLVLTSIQTMFDAQKDVG